MLKYTFLAAKAIICHYSSIFWLFDFSGGKQFFLQKCLKNGLFSEKNTLTFFIFEGFPKSSGLHLATLDFLKYTLKSLTT